MDKPRPKFCVGEEVYALRQSGKWVETEIIEIGFLEEKYFQCDGSIYTGYAYRCSDCSESQCYIEENLRKRPPLVQWSDCEWQPNREEVEA